MRRIAVFAGSALLALTLAGCGSGHASSRPAATPTPSTVPIPAGYRDAASAVLDPDGITITVDGLPWVVPSGHRNTEYLGDRVVNGPAGPRVWAGGTWVALWPVCAADPSLGGC